MFTSSVRAFAVRALAPAVVLIFTTLGSGLGQAQDQPQQSSPAPAVAPETVLATVNGKPVTEADLELALGDLDQQFSRLPPEQRRAAALAAMIDIETLAGRALSAGLDKTPQFQRRIEFLRDRTLYAMLIETEVAGKITEQEIRARYDQEVAAAPPSNEVKARHILVKTKEEALDIIKQLTGGADFEKLANDKTDDPSGKTSGGDLGWFGPGQMVPEFDKAAFDLKPGEFTKEPVQTQFGWHVIKVEDKRVKQPPAFDQVKDQLRSALMREKYFALIKTVRGGAKVDITDPALKAGVEQMQQGQ